MRKPSEGRYANCRYTAEEREHLRRRFPEAGRAAVARELGRSVGAVATQAARVLRVVARPLLSRLAPELRRLHAGGMSDKEIARELGVANRCTVMRWRQALGLPANRSNADGGRLTQRNLAKKAAAYGERSWGARMRTQRRLAADARERGCVDGVQVGVCRVLKDSPSPLTAAQVHALRGGGRNNTAKALRDLAAAGVVSERGGLYSFVPPCQRRGNQTDYEGE